MPRDVTVDLEVTVSAHEVGSGRADAMRDQLVLRVARALHHGGIHDAEIVCYGQRVVYNPLGDDMGHHDHAGHTQAITYQPLDD